MRTDLAHVYVPSLGRARMIDSLAGILRMFPTDMVPTTIVVRDGEVPQYERVVAGRAEVLVCPHEGISLTRRFIGEVASDRGQDVFAMMDDDLLFYIRKQPNDWHLRYAERDEVLRMVRVSTELLRERYSAVGIAVREGFNRLPLAQDERAVQENTRLLRTLMFRTDDFLSCEHGRVPVMEDFDVLLQLLRRGRPNANLTYFAQGQRGTQESGGCSTYRTHALHEEAAVRLRDLHPDFVRLREKRNKSGGAFGHRTEVTISWKRAYESGC